MINATTNIYVQRICLSVKFRVGENPSQNKRTGINYIIQEIINTRLISPNLLKEPFTINNNSNAIALCNTEAQY